MGNSDKRFRGKGESRIYDFRSLLVGANEKVFSLVRVNRESVLSEPGVYSVKGGGKISKTRRRFRGREGNVKLSVVSI